MSNRAVEPYQFVSFRRVLDEAWGASEERSVTLVVDVTTLTRIHVLAFAEWLSEHPESWSRVVVAYTPARGYGFSNDVDLVREQYIDLVFAPIGPFSERAAAEAEGRASRCIAILGHEGVRARLGVSVVTCNVGMAVVVGSKEDADAVQLARQQNATLLEDIESGVMGDWTAMFVYQQDLMTVAIGVRSFVGKTARSDERLVIVPLGPKLVCLQSALVALDSAKSALWVSCPIPAAYAINASFGALPTVFARVTGE